MTHHDHGNPQGLAPEDAAFFKNFTILLVVLTVIGVLAFVLAQFVGYVDTSESPERIAAAERRTEPFGKVSLAGEAPVVLPKVEQPAMPVASALVGGEAIYGAVCAACHAQGVAGAPKTGDAAVWELRTAQGWDVLVGHAINGYQGTDGVMPARGGRADLSDEGVKQAVGYMLAQANLAGAVPAEFLPGAAPSAAAADAAAPTEAAPAQAAPADASSEPAAVADAADVAVPAEPAAVADAAAPTEAAPETPPAEAAPAAAAATPEQIAEGEAIYTKACAVCHGAGVAGAPKLGGAEDWTDRLAQGRATIHEHAIKGFVGSKGVMPAKGGRADLSDDEVKHAVEYMLSKVSG